MKPLVFRLAPLLKMYEAQRDARRVELALAIAEQAGLAAERQRLQRQLDELQSEGRAAQQNATLSAEQLVRGERFRSLVRQQLQAATAREHAADDAVEITRDKLAEAERKVQALERLRQRRHEQHALECLRRETRQFDEIAARLHSPAQK